MVVCKQCLNEINSHNGYQVCKKVDLYENADLIVCGYYSENGDFVADDFGNEECVYCEWCDEYVPYTDAYII